MSYLRLLSTDFRIQPAVLDRLPLHRVPVDFKYYLPTYLPIPCWENAVDTRGFRQLHHS